jgi:hypothetical protein
MSIVLATLASKFRHRNAVVPAMLIDQPLILATNTFRIDLGRHDLGPEGPRLVALGDADCVPHEIVPFCPRFSLRRAVVLAFAFVASVVIHPT